MLYIVRFLINNRYPFRQIHLLNLNALVDVFCFAYTFQLNLLITELQLTLSDWWLLFVHKVFEEDQMIPTIFYISSSKTSGLLTLKGSMMLLKNDCDLLLVVLQHKYSTLQLCMYHSYKYHFTKETLNI